MEGNEEKADRIEAEWYQVPVTPRPKKSDRLVIGRLVELMRKALGR